MESKLLNKISIKLRTFLIVPLLLTLINSTNAQSIESYDIVVYGGTSAGVTAATQASRMGKKVVMICTGNNIGGLTTSGLGATDLNNRQAIGGIAREFYSRIYDYYSHKSAWDYTTSQSYFEVENNRYYGNNEIKRVYGGKDDNMKIMWVFEPHVAQKIFREMLLEAGVKVVLNERIDLKNEVIKNGTVIQSILMESGRQISGRIFIDATYEGDLMAKTRVSYTVGRESNEKYNETLNGLLPLGGQSGFVGMDLYGKSSSEKSIDPFIEEGDPGSGVLPFIEPQVPGSPGEADNRVQAYCYRFTLSTSKRNFRPIEKPSNYNPLWFEHIARVCELNPCADIFKVIGITPLPNKKWDINHCDFVGANYRWPEGNYAIRDSIAQMHKDYALGKVWFLQNDPRVTEQIRLKIREFGLPRDEFQDNDNFPYELYVREARRMISDYVMTEHNVRRTRIAPDPVALGTYKLDSHVVSYFVDNKNRVVTEGGFLSQPENAFPISYQSIRPKKDECTNLLVPVCLSASHVGYGSIRMEPQYMVLGQSAAIAASLAIDMNLSVQDVPYKELKQALKQYNQILEWN